jgi:predicted HicB family RNase H-like nuclease
MIDYKGYSGVFEYDPSIDAFHGRVVGLLDVVTFQGRSLNELRRALAESVEDYLELCADSVGPGMSASLDSRARHAESSSSWMSSIPSLPAVTRMPSKSVE